MERTYQSAQVSPTEKWKNWSRDIFVIVPIQQWDNKIRSGN